MSDFYEISNDVQDKFDYIKYRALLIMFDEKPGEYTSDWSWDLRNPNWMGDSMPAAVKKYRKTLEDAINFGNRENIPEHTQLAFNDLIVQTKELDFDFNRPLDFIVFEALFYKIVTDAYMYQRYSAQSEQLISIELMKTILDDDQYAYISLIYEILQFEFNFWMNYRDNFDGNEFLKNTKAYRAGIHLNRVESQIGTKEYWNEIKRIASSAHNLFPTGELANRIMLISDVQLIYVFGDWKDVYDPANEELVKYLSIRKDTSGNAVFILDCFSDDFEDYCKPLGWITGLPHIEGKTSMDIASSTCSDDEECKDFCDTYYRNTMMLPATVYFPQMDGHYLTSVANEIQYSNNLKHTNEELKNKNNDLNKAQEEKRQIIAEFAHAYGNLQATTLHDVGVLLLRFEHDLVRKCGRKILVEYAIKQNLTKEIEMFKLQFEDRPNELLKKIRGSISDCEGRSVTDLVSDSFQRCFMSILYGKTRGDDSKRELFWGTKNYEEQRLSLQDAFDQDVLVDEEPMLSWLCRKDILKISVNVSERWQTLRFENGEYAALLITNWIAELLTNALKYADKSKPISLSFTQQDGLLMIVIQNTKETTASGLHGTQQGISSIIASLTRLNKAVGCKTEASQINNANTVYQLTLALSEKVLFAD